MAQRIEGDFSRKRRTPDERAMVASPGAYRALARRLFSLDPRSPVRRQLLHRSTVSAYAASNRRDLELIVVRYADDCRYEFPSRFITLGVPAQVDGRDDYISEISEWHRAWSELILTPTFVLDAGATVVVLGRVRIRGLSSGVGLDDPYAQVVDLREGLIQHERDFNSWSEALEAAGLDPGVTDALEALPPSGILNLA